MIRIRLGTAKRVFGCFFIFLFMMAVAVTSPVFALESDAGDMGIFAYGTNNCMPTIIILANNPTQNRYLLETYVDDIRAYNIGVDPESERTIFIASLFDTIWLAKLASEGAHTFEARLTTDSSEVIDADSITYTVSSNCESIPTVCPGSLPDEYFFTFFNPYITFPVQIKIYDELGVWATTMISEGTQDFMTVLPNLLKTSSYLSEVGVHTFTLEIPTGVDDPPYFYMEMPFEVVPCDDLISVQLDVKPGSCANPLNVKSKGVLPVAILGSDSLDVSEIDVESITLNGVPPLRTQLEDVAATSSAESCNGFNPDGILDLSLKFSTQDIVAALGEVSDGESIALKLTGYLLDGTTKIEGEDTVLVLKKGKQ